jgi:GNAT superfamily N-acetyltransferase
VDPETDNPKQQPINLRPAHSGDFDQVYALIKEFAGFLNAEDKVSTTVSQLVNDKDLFRSLVAVRDNTILGFASYFFAYYSWSGKAIYLDDLYVSKHFRGTGIGSSLLNEIISLAKVEQCKTIRWQVTKWNTNAIAFYKSHGARVDDGEMICDLVLDDY